MKRKKLINIIPLLFLFVLSSCSKKETIIDGGRKQNLNFEIKGIEEFDNSSAEIIASKDRTKSTNEYLASKPKVKEKFSHNGLEAEVELFEMTATDMDNKLTSNAMHENDKLKNVQNKKYMNSSPLSSGTTYRVLVYDNSGNLVGTINGTSGNTPSSLDVNYNETYHWYAYSFNQNTALPAVDNIATTPTIELSQSTGLLYDSGTITPTVLGNNKVEVTFKRRLSWIQLIIDSRGTFAPLIASGLRITTNNLNTSTFNIKQNTYSNRTIVQGVIEGSNTFTQLDQITTKDSVYTADIYASDDGRNDDFSINLNKILLKLDYLDGANNANREFNNINYNFNFKPNPGKKYIVRVRLVESGVLIDGTTWARGNLYYTWGDNGFRFRHSNIYPYNSTLYPWKIKNEEDDYDIFNQNNNNLAYSDHKNRATEFWNFKTNIPYVGDQLYNEIKIENGLVTDNSYNIPFAGKGYFYENIPGKGTQYYASIPEGDPCALVYPYDKWRLPTKVEAEKLITQLNLNSNKTTITDNNNQRYTGNFPLLNVTNSPYGNALQFPFNGAIITNAGYSTGFGTGYPSDQLGSTGDTRFGYEMTNSYYFYVNSQPDFEKSAYMMYWTSDYSSTKPNSSNTGGIPSIPGGQQSGNSTDNREYKYGWAFSMKIYDGNFATLDNDGKYTNTIGGYPGSNAGGNKAPQIREAFQGDGLNIRCVRK